MTDYNCRHCESDLVENVNGIYHDRVFYCNEESCIDSQFLHFSKHEMWIDKETLRINYEVVEFGESYCFINNDPGYGCVIFSKCNKTPFYGLDVSGLTAKQIYAKLTSLMAFKKLIE